VNISPDHIQAMKRPVETKAEGLFPTPFRAGISNEIRCLLMGGLFVLHQLKHGTINLWLLKGMVGLLQTISREPIICIKHGHIITLGKLETQIASLCLPTIDRCAQELKTRILPSIFLKDGIRLIG